MKSILFLGGGPLGIPIIKWAKEIGFNVIVNDRNVQSPGVALADVKINFDSTDIRSLTTWAANYNDKFNIRYCYCGSDFGLLTSAVIHDVLDIPHSLLKSIINGLDKNLMKKCWAGSDGINYPLSKIVNSEQEIVAAGKELGWPLIIKPTSSSGSQGVSLANSEREVALYFQEAKKYANAGHIIAEQFIEGSHHDVNGLFWDDVFYPCGIGDRFFTPFPYCVPHHGYFPSKLTPSQRQELYGLLEKGARSMGITWGPVKADAVFWNDQSYILEISPRFHGDIITSNVMGFLKSRNPIYQLLRWIFDKDQIEFLSVDSDVAFVGGWKTLFERADYERLKEKDVRTYLKVEKTEGAIKNNDEILGLAWAWGKDHQQLNELLQLSE
ncbi:MAG: ATP-grasp domain-containing protein [Proteobacteria bacterium]|nr:ATP-grasp domain-containing protein [Pseudomonadota bacterium]